MKIRLFALCLIVALVIPVMAGCQSSAAGNAAESMGQAVESRAESVGETLKQAVETMAPTQPHQTAQPTHPTQTAAATEPEISLEKAQEIALEHAGFTADQVTRLHTEYEIEHGIPEYDVEFHKDNWEYDYEIDARNGEILSFSKDD